MPRQDLAAERKEARVGDAVILEDHAGLLVLEEPRHSARHSARDRRSRYRAYVAEPDDTPSCRICAAPMRALGTLRILGRHEPRLHQCTACGFVQTDGPWWLDEAYSDAITATDLGLLARCRALSARIPSVLACTSALHGPVLDWGGGYGTLTRMLRDQGVDCWHSDPYCSNIHARGFDASLESRERWAAVLAVEVIEHLADPMDFFRRAAARTDLIIATTETVSIPAPALDDWWYWAPEHGQHVAFYSRLALARIGDAIDMRYVRAGRVHAWTRDAGPLQRLAMVQSPLRRALLALRRRKSLLGSDYTAAVRRLMPGP